MFRRRQTEIRCIDIPFSEAVEITRLDDKRQGAGYFDTKEADELFDFCGIVFLSG